MDHERIAELQREIRDAYEHGRIPERQLCELASLEEEAFPAPTEAQNEEFDLHVARLGDDAIKVVLGLDRNRGYSELIYAFDALNEINAEQVLAKLRKQ